jgi:glycosyltransferase involved in cell wall biosynthesis
MRIVVVPSCFPTVSETFVVRHVAGLNAEVFCPEIDTGLLEKLSPRPSVFGKVQEHRETTEPMPRSLLSRVSRRLRREANYIYNPAGNFRWDKESEDSWRAYLEERKPDVVLAEFAPNAFSVLPECIRQGIPVVAHFHGYDTSSMMRVRGYKRALTSLFREAAAVVCVSEFQRKVLLEAGCPVSKLSVIPCGAPVNEFVPTPRVADQPCRFIAVSRLVPGKGPLVTLKAFHRTWKRVPASTLTFVGYGPLKDEMIAYCEANGLTDVVEVIGPVDSSEVRKRMAEACVFLQASLTSVEGWVEGWGVSLAEALASGLPAVVTRSGGMTDLVIDGSNGFLFEEGDHAAMAERMMQLAEDPGLRVKMGKAGRVHVEAAGNLEICLARLRSVLEIACQKRQAI